VLRATWQPLSAAAGAVSSTRALARSV
jgi:hypothetical protein